MGKRAEAWTLVAEIAKQTAEGKGDPQLPATGPW